MKDLFFKILYKFSISAGICIFSLLTTESIADEIKNDDSSKKINTDAQFNNSLLEIPIGNLESAYNRVNLNRNPFQDPIQSDFSKVSNINTVLQFKGIVKSGDKLKAILYTKEGQNLYKVGDEIGNGFLIKSISLQNNSVEISNDFKDYRLSFSRFNNQL